MRARSTIARIVPSLAALLALFTAAPGFGRGSEPPGPTRTKVAVETASSASLELAVERPFESARLTIRRMGGEVVHRGTYTQTPIQLFPRATDEGEALPDGVYVYELVVLPPDEAGAPGADEPPGAAVVSDLFELRAGGLVPKGEPAAEPSDGPTGPTGNVLVTRDSVVNDDLIVEGSVCASDSDLCANGETFLTALFLNAQVKLKDTNPVLWLADSTSGHDDWLLRAEAGTVRLQNADTGADAIFVEELVQDDALYIDSSARIGIGTSNPEDVLHLVHGFPTIRLSEDDDLGASFRLSVDTLLMPTARRLFVIRGTEEGIPLLSIDQDSGRIALGKAMASASLDIAPPEGEADLRLASAGESWRFTNRGEAMTLSRDGSGADEVEIRSRHDAAGPTMVVRGSVQGTQVVNTSSKKHKTGFEEVDAAELLAALEELPVTAWRYRHEPEGTRHVGPVAEDFQALFGLGDGETISTVDALGVLMAAAQALRTETTRLRERVEELERAECSNLSDPERRTVP